MICWTGLTGETLVVSSGELMCVLLLQNVLTMSAQQLTNSTLSVQVGLARVTYGFCCAILRHFMTKSLLSFC